MHSSGVEWGNGFTIRIPSILAWKLDLSAGSPTITELVE